MAVASQTLAAIDSNISANQESSFRAHLGASILGRKCSREIFYSFRWAFEIKHAPALVRLFNRGHIEEARFISYLRAIGCEVWDTNPNDIDPKTGKPRQWRISDCGGHFGGSCDGVGRGIPDLPQGTPFLCEFKTHNNYSFAKLKEEGVIQAKFEHFVQMQVYMFKLDLNFALYSAVNKNTDELHFEIVRLDEALGASALARARSIIFADTPPKRIAESPGAFGCKFCSYNRLCHFGDVEVNRNCRTCRFSRAVETGLWICGLVNQGIPEDVQRKGCNSYQLSDAFRR